VTDVDQPEPLDSSPTPLTRDFIGLCIGILSVVLVILIVAICKWSRCLCLKRSNDNDNPNEVFSSILQHNASTPHPQSRYQRDHNRRHQRSSSCDQRPGHIYRSISNTRDDYISPSQLGHYNNNGYRLNDIKVPRVTITTLPVQPTQQLVPRLSISPQVSGSSITRSTYSLKQ
jgi:hypothetical protein